MFLHCWQRSYAGFLPAGLIGLYDEQEARDLWRRHLEADVAPGLLVAQHRSTGNGPTTIEGTGGELIIGVALVQAAEGYLASLYVDPTRQGTGAGGLLLSHCASLCRAAGSKHLRLWVFETNTVARRFYASSGATLTGRRRVEPQYGVTEVELCLPL